MWERITRWFPRKAVRDISVISAGRFFSYKAGFLYGVFGAYILGAQGWGRLVLIISAVRLISTFLNFRLGAPLRKLVKERLVGEASQRNRDYIRAAFLMQFVASAVFGTVFFLLLVGGNWWIQSLENIQTYFWFSMPWIELFEDLQISLGLFALSEILYRIRNPISAVLQAYEKFGWNTAESIWTSICRDYLTVGFMVWGGVQGACLGFLVAEIFILGFYFVLVIWEWRSSFLGVLWSVPDDLGKAMREIYQNARSNYVSKLITRLYRELSYLFTGGFAGTAGAGYYDIALKFEKILNFMGSSVKTYLFPQFVGKWAANSKQEFYYTLRKYFYQLGTAFFVVAGVLAVAAPWLTPLLYSTDFVESIPLILILLPVFAIRQLFTIFESLSFVISQQRSLVYRALIELLISLPITVLLISTYGYFGAAFGLVCNILLTLTYKVFFFRQHFGWKWIVPDGS